jgi:tetratricopeptide (TPR) repeat protein
MALERDKTQIEAHALLGLVLADAEKADKAITEWHRQLPTTAEDHPDIWTARGAWALRRDEPKMAARCFLEAARRDPDQRVALLELAQILEHQGDAARAAPFRERAEKLAVLEKKLAPLLEQHEDPAPMREVAELATALGRRFEARGWYNMVLAFEPDDESAKKAIAALGLDDDPAAPRVDPSANPALKIDLAEFPAFEPGS